jgi:O-antigen/teichoic acid export membrane protein
VVARRQYRDILCTKSRIDPDTRKEVVRNIKAMFMHKIGSLLVNTIDSLVISVFIGVVALGAYSNYTMIQTSLTGLLVLCFAPLTSVIGHFYAEAEQNAVRLRSEMFHGLNFILGAVFFLGYYAIIDDLIALVFSEELIVDKSISFVITFNGFVQFMRQSTLVFREATGTFYNDRWKPLVEGTLNLVLSIALVNTVGITGVILATIVTNLLICHIVEPYVLYRYAFNESPKHYYIENYAMIAAFAAALCVMHLCSVSLDNRWQELLLNGCISVALSSVVCGGMVLVNKPLRMSLRRLLKR